MKMELNYRKIKPLNLESLAKQYNPTMDDQQYAYNPFSVSQIQAFNPLYTDFFVLSESNYNRIGLNTKNYVDEFQIKGTSVDYHVKCSPLLDPVHYLIGKYEAESTSLQILPSLTTTATSIHHKIANKQNASYVDGFFCYLSSQMLHTNNMLNAVDFYGSFLAIQNQFKANITDDVEYLYKSQYFMEHLGKEFSVSCGQLEKFDDFTGIGSRANKKRLVLGSEELSMDDLLVDEVLANPEAAEYAASSQEFPTCEYEKSEKDEESSESEDDDDDALNYSSSESDNVSSRSEESEESDLESGSTSECLEQEAFAYIKDFPANLIFLEKCDGTLDELFMKNEIDEQLGAACLMQIIMSLIAFQKAFQLTHNDLHTNNVMYVNTEAEFLYYKYNNQFYKVPTYGRIFKIIDFGRAIYRFKDKRYCSDSFAPKGDAHTQYNTEPYFNERKPRIEPNPSFDLCRLGTSIYDFIIHDEDEPRDSFQETIYRWCLDDNEKNIMYKRDGEERYPGFKLYKMIAKNVHAHSPQAQLKYEFFSQFLVAPSEAAKLEESEVRQYGLNIDSVEREYL
jgi:hypothetical protein